MKKYTRNNLLLILLLIIEIIFVKLFVYNILPEKYRYDSGHIIEVMRGKSDADRSYKATADFYNAINIFSLDNVYDWNIFIGFFSVIFIVILIGGKEYNLNQLIFIFYSVLFLNIYTFVLGKELIQIIFYLIIYLIILSKMKEWGKNILIFTIFIIESIYFRVYYLIIGSLFIFLSYSGRIKPISNKKKSLVKIIFFTIIFMVIESYILSIVSKENYNSLALAREGVNIFRIHDLDATSIINNVFPNSNIIYFFINTIINILRILFPIELLFKSINYLPFVIYQTYITYTLAIYAKKNIINNKNKVLKKDNIDSMFYIIISFLTVASIFEPDFGSLARHESVLFMFILAISIDNYQYNKKNKREYI